MTSTLAVALARRSPRAARRPRARRDRRSPGPAAHSSSIAIVDRRRDALRRQRRRRLGLGHRPGGARARRRDRRSAPRRRRRRRAATFTPAVMPRALALSPDGDDAVRHRRALRAAVRDRRRVGARSRDGRGRQRAGRRRVVAPTARRSSSRARRTARSCASTRRPRRSTRTRRRSAASRGRSRGRADGSLLVTHLFSGAASTAIDPDDDDGRARRGSIPDTAPRGDARLAHGQVARPLRRRGAARHATSCGSRTRCSAPTPRSPTLDFESHRVPVAVDPRRRRHVRDDAVDRRAGRRRASTARSPTSSRGRTRSRSPATARYALVVDTNSEDVLAVDAGDRVEAALAAAAARATCPRASRSRPTTRIAYIDERNTGDVAVVAHRSQRRPASRSPSTARRSRGSRRDPMPAQLRLGQHLFYSANSDEYPITTNHWVACATLPHGGPQRRGDVAVRAGPARHAVERRRHARHRLSVPHRRSQPGPGLLAHDQHRAGRHVRSGRAERRCSTRSPRTSTTASRCRSRRRPIPRWSRAGQAIFDERRRRLRDLPRRPALHRLGRRQPDARSRRARSLLARRRHVRDRRRSPTSRTTTSTATRAPRACSTRRRCPASRRSPPYLHDGSARDAARRARADARHDGRHHVAVRRRRGRARRVPEVAVKRACVALARARRVRRTTRRRRRRGRRVHGDVRRQLRRGRDVAPQTCAQLRGLRSTTCCSTSRSTRRARRASDDPSTSASRRRPARTRRRRSRRGRVEAALDRRRRVRVQRRRSMVVPTRQLHARARRPRRGRRARLAARSCSTSTRSTARTAAPPHTETIEVAF